MAYLELEHNPDLLHWYLMRVAQRVSQVLSKEPGAITLEMHAVDFERVEELTMEEAAARAKAAWRSHLRGRRDGG